MFRIFVILAGLLMCLLGPFQGVTGASGSGIGRPELSQFVKPLYPREAILEKVQGTVVVEIIVDKAGNVRSAKVTKSVPLLDEVALQTVKAWKFQPLKMNGVFVEFTDNVRFDFKL